jgi:uncharacterized protein (TIGR00159 family)
MNNFIVLFFLSFHWEDMVDIFLVSVLIYQLYKLVRGTAAMNIFVGVAVFYLFYRTVRLFNLELFSSILGKFIDVGVIALLIVFQQELRRFFLFIGTYNLAGNQRIRKAIFNWGDEGKDAALDINAVIKSCRNMSEAKTGALIIVTRGNDLKFYTNTGDPVEAQVSVRMIESIFFKNSPLHDGAVIISNNTIRAARCVLPVTENNSFPAHLGMRHRAAVGITENTDALAIVVSEQTGEIAFARDGEMENAVSPEKLKELLEKYLTN